jgi:hypothetical protein
VGLAQGGNGAGAGAEFCEIDPPTTVTFRNVTFTEGDSGEEDSGGPSFNVYRSEDGGDFMLHAELVTGSEYLDVGVPAAIGLTYEVTSVNATGESEPSNQASAILRVPCFQGALDGAPPIDGLQFWVDAADIDGDDDTVDNPAPGEAVSLWRDKTCGLELEQSDAAAQPVMSTLNGRPAVDFTNDQWLVDFSTGDAYFPTNTAGSMVSILSTRNSAQSFYFELARDNGGCDWVIDMPDCALHESTLLPYVEAGGFGAQGIGEIPPGSDANIANLGEVPVPTDDSLQYSIWSGGTGINWNYATNGGPPVDGRNFATPSRETWWSHVQDPGGPKYVSLGAGRTRSGGVIRGNFYAGRIAEILIYDHPLDETERQAISAYVGAKYFVEFRRGDHNVDGKVDLADAVSLFTLLFVGGPEATCKDAGDANNDGARDMADGVSILNWLFLGGDVPPAPGPFSCGTDPGSSLGCAGYDEC